MTDNDILDALGTEVRRLSADSREIDQILRVGVTHQYVA